VGALCARSAVLGAYLNVRINVPGLTDESAAAAYLERGRELQEQAVAAEAAILRTVDSHL
jgi:glutamate formiminotransferase/formiminotetrahydrofolate cyclodeaminase